MTDDERQLSEAIEEARHYEDHYRQLLVFWKRRRQRLEQQIPLDNIHNLVDELVNEIWSSDNDDDGNRTYPGRY